jgi:rubrerythrin
MLKSEENLNIAYVKESMASKMYCAFAKRARIDGFPNIARLFRLTSEVERIHAKGNLNSENKIESTSDNKVGSASDNKVGSTLENIKAAIARERNESQTLYPSMLKQAISDNHNSKLRIENNIKSKRAHANLYFSALVALIEGKDLADSELYFCPFCGNFSSEPPKIVCSICSSPANQFIKI